MEGLSLAGGDEGEGSARVLDSALGQLVAEVRGDALDVVHDHGGLFEDAVVDALVDIADLAAVLPVFGDKRVVDVAVSVGPGILEIAGNIKRGANGAESGSGLGLGHLVLLGM